MVTVVILALGRVKQEDCCKWEVSLGYRMRLQIGMSEGSTLS